MQPRFHAQRRVNPYRGVLEVVDMGEATAHSHDGVTWQLRADDGQGGLRPVGIWVAGQGLVQGRAHGIEALLAVLETDLPLPFACFDTWEHWLLDKESGLPLAILATALGSEPRPVGREPQWLPFVLRHAGFHAPSLAHRDRAGAYPEAHRDILARMVNQAARPFAMTQWFQRDRSGAGVGDAGTRLPPAWRGRRLPAEAFPPLLVRETWNSRLEQSVIADYHAALAPLLLLWPRLDDARRERLEVLACARPQWLARVHRLLPRVLDRARLNAALVAARLQAAQGITEHHCLDD